MKKWLAFRAGTNHNATAAPVRGWRGHDCRGRACCARHTERPVQVSIHASAWPFSQAQIIVSRFVPAPHLPRARPYTASSPTHHHPIIACRLPIRPFSTTQGYLVYMGFKRPVNSSGAWHSTCLISLVLCLPAEIFAIFIKWWCGRQTLDVQEDDNMLPTK
jgi:hypothetical protein